MVTLQEIIQKQKVDDSKYKVNVCVTCHNQASYIGDALDSILIQKTTFPFQIVVGDDCSTDGSVEILKRYEIQYPEIIRVIFHPQNVGVNQNRKEMFEQCNAPYLALCDGDDFWCGEQILEKKYEFLEAHPEYMGYTTATRTIRNGVEFQKNDLIEKKAYGVFGRKEALTNSYPGLYGAFFFRNVMKYMDRSDFNQYTEYQVDDSSKLPIVSGIIGDIYRCSEVTYIYRWIENSLEHTELGKNRCKELWISHMVLIKMVEQLFDLSGKEGMQIDGQMETLAVDAFITACKSFFKGNGKTDWEQFKYIYQDGYFQKQHICNCILKRLMSKIRKSDRV